MNTKLNSKLLIPSIILMSMLSSSAYASEITGTLSAGGGGATTSATGSGSLSGTVATTTGTGSLSGTVIAPSAGSTGSSGGSSGASGSSGGNGAPVGLITGSAATPVVGPANGSGGSSNGQVLGNSTSSNVPGLPNTGAGGNAAGEAAILVVSGLIAIYGAAYLRYRIR